MAVTTPGLTSPAIHAGQSPRSALIVGEDIANQVYRPVAVDSSGAIATQASVDVSALAVEDGGNLEAAATSLSNIETALADLALESGGNLDTLVASVANPSTATVTTVTMTGATDSLVSANASRKGLYVFNNAAKDVYVKLGTSASAISFTVKLADQQYFELPSPVYTGAVTAFATVGGDVLVTEV
jgi:hypothetical protein